jgi:hypothetical protein
MCMRDKNLGDSSHLDWALLYLLLRAFPTVKQPDVSVEPQRERGVVSCTGRLCGGRPQEGDIDA